MVCKRVLLSGKVQGVSFRHHTLLEAKKLGKLTGFVQNLAGGRVEMIICGEEANVEKLIAWARLGPPASRVDSVLVNTLEVPPADSNRDFFIKRG